MVEDKLVEEFIEIIQEEYLTDFCASCIQNICNISLTKVMGMTIESADKRIACYIDFLIEQVEKTEVCCLNKEFGCGYKSIYKDSKEHTKVCKLNRKRCNECDIIFNTDEYVNHICPTIRTNCPESKEATFYLSN